MLLKIVYKLQEIYELSTAQLAQISSNHRFFFPGLYLNDIPSFLFVEKFLLTSTKRARKPKLEKMAAGEKTMYRKKQILLAEEKQMKKWAS